MTRSPIVSIIVNNYNYGRFLGEAIDSALAQTYPNTEVIVVDDGSTDNSREVIAGYGERIVPVLKANGGQASAFNAGFAASHGDLILFLDSDDMLAPNAIETVIRGWREGMARLYFPLCVVDASGRPTGGVMGGTMSPDPMSGPFCGGSPTSGNVFSRAALDKIMPIPDEHWRGCADMYVNASSTLFGEVVRLEQPLATYRIHGRNNEACAEEVASFRNRTRLDLRLYDDLFNLTDGKMPTLENWLGTSPQHWVRRIKLLRERPGDYPWPDTFGSLTAHAAKACWREPGRSFRHRLAYTIFVFAYGLLPSKATSGLRWILRTMDGRERGRTFRVLLGA